jgi:CRISPR-associated endoribonuclease Cas6
MTTTNKAELLANLIVVFQSTSPRETSISLTDWLTEFSHPLTWITLEKKAETLKLIPVLPKSQLYGELLQLICSAIPDNITVKWQDKNYILTGVELNKNDLNLIQLSISSQDKLPQTLGRAIHAQFFHWLSLADSHLAEKLHQEKSLPVTLVIKPSPFPRQIYLRISLLQKELLSPLLWGLSKDLGQDFLLTNIPCHLGESWRIIHSNNFQSLSEVNPQKIIQLQFLSPTSFKQGDKIQPFPLPELVFESLRRRWNYFAPEHLHFSEIEWQGFTCAYELKTHALKMKGSPEIGTTGWVRYEFPSEQASIATILAHFASFAGVGRKTAMGMGQTQLSVNSN